MGKLIRLVVLVTAGLISTQLKAEAESKHHEYHDNTIGLFAGYAYANRRDDAAAFGIEYTRRLNQSFSIGAVAEYTTDDADFWLYAIPLGFHVERWKFYVAPGIEDGHHGNEELLRLGVEYAFELGAGWEIAPQLNVDFVDSDDVWVLGLVFARGF